MKKICAALLAALLLALPACGKKNTRYEAQFLTLFDTVTTIVGYRPDKEIFTEEARFIHDELEIYHRLYDIYHDYEGLNNLKTVNDRAGIEPVRVDGRIIGLLEAAREANQSTKGRVNAAFGSVLSLWHEYRQRGLNDPGTAVLPPMEKLLEAAGHTDMERVVIDRQNATVFLKDPAMRLDVGAIAKGYAVEQVCRAAEEKGMGHLLVSVGGNVRAIGGMDEGGGPWRVGIQDPQGEGSLLTLGLRDYSLVTSGGYQRYYTVEGVRYHHIIDPGTLMPAEYLTAVSVLAADSGGADALSTALFNMPYEQGAELVERMEGVEAMWILKDGTKRVSSGFQQYVLPPEGG